ncbi:MAG: aldose 1-epimerase family protein [Chitinophagaceae bacterium]|nr:aldose 1-epimerase family protein [Chitinophagaceae bacterium]
MISINNPELRAVINPLGAELCSLVATADQLEYVWQANPAFWGKHSPVLFPVVGTLKNNTYTYNGHSYMLPRHGFAREKVFEVNKPDEATAIFTLHSNTDSYKVYPFAFELRLIYKLNANELSLTYQVYNPSDEVMYFSIGGHPAFNVPLSAGSAYTDYYLQFNATEPLVRYHLKGGLLSSESSEVNAENGRIALHPALFYEDAIVLKHLQSNVIELGSTMHKHGLSFDFTGFPYLGIWAAKDAPFVCIEPWCGHADTVEHNQKFNEKPGIEQIEAREFWERTWKVKVF